MKYYTAKIKLKRKDKKELLNSLTALDRTLLKKAQNGCDIVGLIGSGKPFVNKWGGKEFATTDRILFEVNKLVKKDLLERR